MFLFLSCYLKLVKKIGKPSSLATFQNYYTQFVLIIVGNIIYKIMYIFYHFILKTNQILTVFNMRKYRSMRKMNIFPQPSVYPTHSLPPLEFDSNTTKSNKLTGALPYNAWRTLKPLPPYFWIKIRRVGGCSCF